MEGGQHLTLDPDSGSPACLPGVWKQLTRPRGFPFQTETLPNSFSCCNPRPSIRFLSWTLPAGSLAWGDPASTANGPVVSTRQEHFQSCQVKS